MRDGRCEDGYTVVFVANRGYRDPAVGDVVDLSKDKTKSKDPAPKKNKKADIDTAKLDQQFGDAYDEIWPEQAQQSGPFFDAHEMSAAAPHQGPPPGAIPVPLVRQHVNSHARPPSPLSTTHFPPRPSFPPDPPFFHQTQADQFNNRRPQETVLKAHRHVDQFTPYPRQRETAIRDRLLSEERHKLARWVSDEVRGAMREAAEEDQARLRRPADSLGARAPMRSDRQDDSSVGCSQLSDGAVPDGRIDPNRPGVQHFSSRAVSGARPYVDSGRVDRRLVYPTKPLGFTTERARPTDSTRAQRQIHEDRPLSRPGPKISASADRVAFRPRASAPEAREFVSSSSARSSSPDRDTRRCSSGATRRAKGPDRARRDLEDRVVRQRDPQWVSERSSEDSESADHRYRSVGRWVSGSVQKEDGEVPELSDESLDDAELYEQLLRKFTGRGLRESVSDDDGAGGDGGELVEGLDDGSVDDEGHAENHVDGIVGRNADEPVDENGNGISDGDFHDDVTDSTPRASGVDQAHGTT